MIGRPENITAPELAHHLQQELIGVGIRTSVNTIVNRENFSDSLKSNLQFAGAAAFGAQFSKAIGTLIKEDKINQAQQLIAHALVGCASAAIGGASCGGSAIGAALGEAVSDLAYNGLGVDQDRAATIGRYAALASSLITANEALDVTFTNLAASNAIANNFLLPKESLKFAEEYERCSGHSDCQIYIENKWKPILENRLGNFQKAIDEYKNGNTEQLEKLHVKNRLQLSIEGYEFYKEYPNEFIPLSDEEAVFHTYVLNEDGNAVKVTTEQLNYTKYIHPIAKYEVVLDENNNIVTDPINAGTYNYFNPETGGFNHPFISNNAEHFNLDVVPYFLIGNSNGDTTSLGQRILRNTYWLKKQYE